MTADTLTRFRRWFWRPPRPHGDLIQDRTVSFLELFYDLAYVAVIGQAADHLVEHVTLQGFAEFAVVFALIWIGWINGSLYVELHGRDDGRTRTIVFVQMGILVLLAVFAAHAADDTGRPFAFVYAAFLAVLTWLWSAVRVQDRGARPDLLRVTKSYVVGIAASVFVILASAYVTPEWRLVVWAAFAVFWVVGIAFAAISPAGFRDTLMATDSLVERFGLFTIIVLGEVIFGVVDGLSAAEPDVQTIVTGIIALVVGFGLWWIYFDLVGRRWPRNDGAAIGRWVLSHLPLTLSIAAAGAAMVSLIEHAHDAATPASTAWLLAGAVAGGLVSTKMIEGALVDAQRLATVYRPLGVVVFAGAIASLAVGWLRPAPWLFALLLVGILSAIWLFAVGRFLRAGAWGEAVEPASNERA